jgi:hypothetical protein
LYICSWFLKNVWYQGLVYLSIFNKCRVILMPYTAWTVCSCCVYLVRIAQSFIFCVTKNSLKIQKKRNQKPYIEERQTMQFLEEEKDKQRSTKTLHRK